MSVKQTLEYYKIRPDRESGQHFIQDEKLVDRFIEAAGIQPKDIVFEIGPGLGILTQKLCKIVDTIIAVEKDSSLFKFLRQRFKNQKNLILLNEDILNLRLEHFHRFSATTPLLHYSNTPLFKIVSNVPYSISSDFLYWLLENRKCIKSSFLILQKEVAKRLTAKPGTKPYGSLSVFFQAYTDVKLLFPISGRASYPNTSVTSTAISVSPKEVKIENEELFFKIVKSAFAHRRKQLKNSLAPLWSAYTSSGIDLSRRPETLSYKEFIKLTSVHLP